MVAEFKKHGLVLKERRAGQFAEVNAVTPWPSARRLIHAFNNAWLPWIRLATPAYSNLLVFHRSTARL